MSSTILARRYGLRQCRTQRNEGSGLAMILSPHGADYVFGNFCAAIDSHRCLIGMQCKYNGQSSEFFALRIGADGLQCGRTSVFEAWSWFSKSAMRIAQWQLANYVVAPATLISEWEGLRSLTVEELPGPDVPRIQFEAPIVLCINSRIWDSEVLFRSEPVYKVCLALIDEIANAIEPGSTKTETREP